MDIEQYTFGYEKMTNKNSYDFGYEKKKNCVKGFVLYDTNNKKLICNFMH